MRQADEPGIGFAWNAKREAARDQNNLLMGSFLLELTLERVRTGTLKLGPFAFCNCSSRLALNRRLAIDATWNELVESEPRIDGGIQADAKKRVCGTKRIYRQIIHLLGIFRTMEWHMPNFR